MRNSEVAKKAYPVSMMNPKTASLQLQEQFSVNSAGKNLPSLAHFYVLITFRSNVVNLATFRASPALCISRASNVL